MRFAANSVIVIFFVALAGHLQAQTSLNMALLDNWHEDSLITTSFSEVRYNDCFGFVWNGREYAVAGSTEGTHIFEISDENHFIPKGYVKGRFSHTSVSHRDYGTYQHYLYAVCDEGISDLQIIDFQYLPDSIHLVKEDSVQFGRVHNIFIDTIQAKLYSCIHRSTVNTQTIDAAMKVFSIADPLNPVELYAGPDDIIEVHDCYVRNGKAILNCGFDGMRVYDFTDATNPSYLSSKTFYTDQGYNHQGWLTPGGDTYIFADETNGMRVKKCSFNGNQITIQQLFGTNAANGSVPHNIMATDTFAFVAYYNEGLRIFDLRYPDPLEIAHYDTYPDEVSFKMNGNWGVYSLLPSQRILASDRQYGLFLLYFDRGKFKAVAEEKASVIYPNPFSAGEEITIRLPHSISDFSWELYDETGNIVVSGSQNAQNYFTLKPEVASGVYQLRLHYPNTFNDDKAEVLKLIVL